MGALAVAIAAAAALLVIRGARRPLEPVLARFSVTAPEGGVIPIDMPSAAISPDGRWLAYDSDETGTFEIYVRSFPEPGEKHRITTSGGAAAQWSQDGRELLIWGGGYVHPGASALLSVDVETTPSFKAGTPRVLFTPPQDLAGLAATRDLQRFLAAVPVERAAPYSITVILNWQAALKR